MNLTKDLVLGWNMAARATRTINAMDPDMVPLVDILVDDGACALPPETREAVGEPLLAWVPREALRPGPYGGTAVTLSPDALSGANRHRRGSVRTIGLLRDHRGDPVAQIRAALLAAVVATRNLDKRFHDALEETEQDLLAGLGLKTVLEVWMRRNSSPMAISAPDALLDPDLDLSDGVALGGVFYHWHEMCLRRFVPVEMTPVRFGTGLLTLADAEAVGARLEAALAKGYGTATWKELDRAGLECRVWSTPAMQLSVELGVSDVAIAKRCRSLGIARPPRGYWQRLEAERDPRSLLADKGIEAPDFVLRDLAARFDPPRLAA